MAASRSSRVTRSSVGLNGLDENFCGRTLRNRSIAQPEETSVCPLPRARSPKKKPEWRQESKPDAKQDIKQDTKQDAKHETKQDAKDYTRHEGQHQPSLQGKVTDLNASLSEAVQWMGSRKRGMSCLENDTSPEKAENCDRGTGSSDTIPQIKKTKRCSHSGDFQGQEKDTDLLRPESPASVPEPNKDSHCEGVHSQNAAKADVSADSGNVEREPITGTADDGHVQLVRSEQASDTHKTSNGLGENKAEELSGANNEPASVNDYPSLPNGSQIGDPSSPDLSVPSKNSAPLQLDVSGSGELLASSMSTFEAIEEDSIPELTVATEQEVEEVEVDVVGESLCRHNDVPTAHEELVMETENDSNGQEAAAPSSSTHTIINSSPISNNSGETTPPFKTGPSPTEPGCNPPLSSTPPSFTELYEHRYTLRTSPRRVANSGKVTSTKVGSPPRDNGTLTEEGEMVVGPGAECLVVEESDLLGSAGPSIEEPVSSVENPCDGADDLEGVPMEETERGQEMTQSQAAKEEEEEPDVYFFESDHLALKHNKDYQRLLQTISVLEAQRAQAILDLETLACHQRGALDDPIKFVEQLQEQVNLGLPRPQRVVQLPDIAWGHYTSGLGDFEREFCDKKCKTRRLKLMFDKGLPERPNSPIELKREGESSSMYSPLPTSDAPGNGRQIQIIRGRICHPNKPDTFNQLWTVEEQKKLEQLLVKYPPEEVESRRWQKIADELGNRTAKQVASRVQKYFIKLTKAGIPVPGRTPNLCMYTKKASSKRQHHLNKHLYRPSTFLTSYEPPVYMDEDDERSAYYSFMHDPSAEESDEESIPMELRDLPEYKELLQLKRLKKKTLQDIREDKTRVQHIGYKCDVCGIEPIQGVRWHCQDCPQDNATDFCSNCSDCIFKTETHKPNHHLEPVHQPETYLDRDYCLPQNTGYNYLDPNYFPANR